MNDIPGLFRETMATAIPAVMGALVCFSQETINLVFVGSLNQAVPLAAVGMGNIFINMFGVSIYFGLNGAVDTLVSQANGAKDLRLCGAYLQRGRLLNTVIYVPILIIFALSGPLLRSLGQDAAVSSLAANYILAYAPGVYFLALYDLQRRFLIQTGHSDL